MPQLVSERPIFLRETADGAYLPVTFLIAKTIEECIIILPFALIYFAAVFFSVGLQGNFLISFGLFYLTVIVGLATPRWSPPTRRMRTRRMLYSRRTSPAICYPQDMCS